MSTNPKKQISPFLTVLDQTQHEIEKAVYEKRYGIALQLLEECQEGAIQIGTLIEQVKGEGFVTVGILEEYCETIYQIHEGLAQDDSSTHQNKSQDQILNQDIYQHLSDLLVRVQNSIDKDFIVKKEVVFLPYKASMWDSLESVWKAAKEDPEYDTYVVPIPYYDKNNDGSLGNMHYEGDQFPEYVTVTDYKNYDFENRHPDIIFIHNPYDNNNYVTSVHPFFYSKNIKNFTDKLIYIPYFVLKDIDLNNKKDVEDLEHFVAVPAVLHSDAVIVQSEDMRKAYIQTMTRLVGENSRTLWEQKIVGIGSPKYDKVHNTNRDEIEIPKDWKALIDNQDGSHKKVIMYNTSVTALLEHGGDMLDKIRQVLSYFEEHKDKVVLLWRPHPLIQATISSMRPELWQEYLKIVTAYRQSNWGIYDDSADLDRAIAMSDAYYGDESSVVQLCNTVHMPIMIQNMNVK